MFYIIKTNNVNRVSSVLSYRQVFCFVLLPSQFLYPPPSFLGGRRLDLKRVHPAAPPPTHALDVCLALGSALPP